MSQPHPLDVAVRQSYVDRLHSKLVDPDRLKALYSSNFWQKPLVDKLQMFCRTAATMLDCPMSQLNLLTDDQQHTVASFGTTETIKPSDLSVCQHVLGLGHRISVADVDDHPVLCNVAATSKPAVAYLGVPIVTRDGFVIGTLCVIDVKTRSWTEHDVSLLTQLTSTVMDMHESQVLN